MDRLELGLGLDIVLWFESWRTPLVEAFFGPFNFLGGTLFYLLLLPAIYWCVDASFGRRALLTFLGVVFAALCLKLWWARPRPFQISTAVHPLLTPHGPGIPSGHAMMATALWGLVALQVRRRPITALVLAFIVLMGLSRLVAGVHYPQDVLAGWLLGGLVVTAWWWGEPRLSTWVRDQILGRQLGLALAMTAALLCSFRCLEPFSAPVFTRYGAMVAGLFLGSAIGFALEVRTLGFNAGGGPPQRLSRLLVGGAPLFGLVWGLRVALRALPAGSSSWPTWLALGGYVVIGLWLSLGAPYLFCALGLARRSAPHGVSPGPRAKALA